MKKTLYLIGLLICFQAHSQTVHILFDATKAETATNADWIIDADTHNIDWYPNAILNGNGNESNAQQTPMPLQSGITSTTAETYWNGALSNWGIDCVKQGYAVETLPYNGSITYNNSSNPQDLSHYKIFVVCEPNILFTTAQKTAILNFISNGGSLYMISDHDQSDRNNDGADSPAIWNNLIGSNAFGITFNLNNMSAASTAMDTSPNDSLINGPYGVVSQVYWSGGTDMTLNTTINPTVRAAVYTSGFLNNNTRVMCAYGRYGLGKFAAIGDSSPFDDGTGDPNDVLYTGYTGDAAGNHRKLIMNTTIWLATDGVQCVYSVASEPAPTSVYSGSAASFSVTTSAASPAYQWQYGNGATYTNLSNGSLYSGVTTNALHINAATASMNNYLYRCVISSGACTDTSASALLTVSNPPPSCNDSISIQPQSVTVNAGQNALFSVSYTNAAATFQWQSQVGSTYNSLSNGAQYNGVNTSQLTVLTATTLLNGISYRCLVNYNLCHDTSTTASLTVTPFATGINSEEASQLLVYPNPVSTMLHIVSPNEMKEIDLIDLQGRVQGKNIISFNKSIDLPVDGLAKGLYVMKVITADGAFHYLRWAKQ